MKLYILAICCIISAGFYYLFGSQSTQSENFNSNNLLGSKTNSTNNKSDRKINNSTINIVNKAGESEVTESQILTKIDGKNQKTDNEQQLIADNRKKTRLLLENTLDKNNIISIDNLTIALNSENFEDIISIISENSDISEIERKNNIYQSLNGVSEINIYNYDVACGKGLCALNIQDIPSSEVATIKKVMRERLNLGSSFSSVIKDSEGFESDIRMITQSQPSDKVQISSKEMSIF